MPPIERSSYEKQTLHQCRFSSFLHWLVLLCKAPPLTANWLTLKGSRQEASLSFVFFSHLCSPGPWWFRVISRKYKRSKAWITDIKLYSYTMYSSVWLCVCASRNCLCSIMTLRNRKFSLDSSGWVFILSHFLLCAWCTFFICWQWYWLFKRTV